MKKIIRLTEYDLTRLVKRIIKETKEIDEIFGFGKRRRDNDEEYVKAKFRGENDARFIQKNGVEPYVIGDRVEFSFDRVKLRNGDEQRLILRAIYKKNSNTLKTETTPLKISDDEVDRLNNKYFD
jgi:hypothetical protein